MLYRFFFLYNHYLFFIIEENSLTRPIQPTNHPSNQPPNRFFDHWRTHEYEYIFIDTAPELRLPRLPAIQSTMNMISYHMHMSVDRGGATDNGRQISIEYMYMYMYLSPTLSIPYVRLISSINQSIIWHPSSIPSILSHQSFASISNLFAVCVCMYV